MTHLVSFRVVGVPAPAGSKTGYIVKGHVVITDASRRSKPWKALVSAAAAEMMERQRETLLEGPLMLDVTFYMPRPKSHLGKRGVRPSAPAYPTVKPDTLKLVRGTEDALTSIVYRDDAQIVEIRARKRYGVPARAEITVCEWSEAVT